LNPTDYNSTIAIFSMLHYEDLLRYRTQSKSLD
jgi:hypothetical protein